MQDDGFELYGCRYAFEGGEWGIHIYARSREEAERRRDALARGEVYGPITIVPCTVEEAARIASRLEAESA